MTSTKMITSDVVSRLAKIREGVVYNSITSFVSELFQNCQRAEASEIMCVTGNDYIKIRDNGKGCKNPDDLFTIDKSVWGSTDEGFGEGFTSVYTIADRIKIRSRNWSVDLDVENMITKKDLSYKVEYHELAIDGFEVELFGQKIQANQVQLESFIKESAALLPMNVYVDGELINKKDMSELNQQYTFQRSYSNDLYKAYLTPKNYSGSIAVYYESRKVCEEYTLGVSGNLILKKGAVNLKAPDRKAIVDDIKYRKFKREIREDVRELYKELIKYASSEIIDELAYSIANILEVKDYEDLLDIKDEIFETQKKEVDEEQSKLLEAKIDVFSDGERKEESETTVETIFCGTAINDQGKLKMVKALNGHAKKASVASLAKSDKVFFITKQEILSSEEAIRNMEYYGFKGLVAINELYERVFRHYGVPHLSDLINSVEKIYTKTDIGAKTLKERRVLYLLNKIERHYQLGAVFNIGNLSLKIVSNVTGRELSGGTTQVSGWCDGEGRIYLDRRMLKMADYNPKSSNANMTTVEDMRLLLRNLDTIAHELAHLLYRTKDNTLEHMVAQAKISKEIGYIY